MTELRDTDNSGHYDFMGCSICRFTSDHNDRRRGSTDNGCAKSSNVWTVTRMSRSLTSKELSLIRVVGSAGVWWCGVTVLCAARSYFIFFLLTDSKGNLKKDIDNEDTDLDKTKFFYKTPEESEY